MKKIVAILLLLIIFIPTQQSLAFGKKKNKDTSNKKGYYGKLPNINGEFDEERKSKETQSPVILNNDSFNIDSKDMKKAPLDNTQYIDVIVKKSTTGEFVNDINELVPILQKLRACVEQEKDIQKFNAIVSNYIDNVAYIENKYKNKPEMYYTSYERITDTSKYLKKVAITRTEAQTYTKYLGYSEANGAYSPDNIKKLLEGTLVEIEDTLDVIKEVK